MLEKLKQAVYQANLLLPAKGLVLLTWGNVSAITDDRKMVIIKPSGVEYSAMKPEQMVVVDMAGKVLEGDLNPSSDLDTHLELYRKFDQIGGIVHTHSRYATAFAQAERRIHCYGTTHADYFSGAIPCTRPMTSQEILNDYELNTARVIIETFQTEKLDPSEIPAVIVCKHGPFIWGANVNNAVENAIVLEEVARMALLSEGLSPDITSAKQNLLEKHYYRKHGANAYYGQTNRTDTKGS